MTILDFVGMNTTVRPGINLVPLSNVLWRVTRTGGEVLGYIESVGDGATQHFASRRLVSSQRATLPLGDFWKMDDAVDCFRL